MGYYDHTENDARFESKRFYESKEDRLNLPERLKFRRRVLGLFNRIRTSIDDETR